MGLFGVAHCLRIGLSARLQGFFGGCGFRRWGGGWGCAFRWHEFSFQIKSLELAAKLARTVSRFWRNTATSWRVFGLGVLVRAAAASMSHSRVSIAIASVLPRPAASSI